MSFIYDKEGYVRIDKILEQGFFMNLVYGGRGTGKTYGALKYVLEHDKEFILLRRTQAQIDIIGRQEFSPFKALEKDLGVEVTCKSVTKYTSGFFIGDKLIGIACALSTFSNLRGFSSNAELLIFDEFIPERHERPIKEEGAAFLNVIETVNRNRELNNGEPIQVLCLANANDIGNPIFMELGLIKEAEKLKISSNDYRIDIGRGLMLVDLKDSEISKKKSQTALYKLVNNSSFKSMALENKFIDDSIAIIKSENLKNYDPLVTIADCTFYKHKGSRKYYMSEHRVGTPEILSTASADIEQFRKKYYYLYGAYLGRKILFENKLCAVLFEKLW